MDFKTLAPLLGPIQKAMADANTERKATTLIGKAGGGTVTIAIKGDLTVEKVQIAPAATQGGTGILEDLVHVALNDALRQHRERFGAGPDEQMQKIFQKSGGGGLFGMLGK